MSIPSRHVHAKKYFGEFDAMPVVRWLNSKQRPAGDVVEKLIQWNRELPIRGTVGSLSPVKERKVQRYLATIVRETKFAVAPVLASAKRDEWRIDWKPVGNMDHEQYLALWKLLYLAEKGKIGSLRPCAKETCRCPDTGRPWWFYVRFKHQRFHSEQCQQETFKSRPSWKKKRAKDMKKYRRDKKAGR